MHKNWATKHFISKRQHFIFVDCVWVWHTENEHIYNLNVRSVFVFFFVYFFFNSNPLILVPFLFINEPFSLDILYADTHIHTRFSSSVSLESMNICNCFFLTAYIHSKGKRKRSILLEHFDECTAINGKRLCYVHCTDIE